MGESGCSSRFVGSKREISNLVTSIISIQPFLLYPAMKKVFFCLTLGFFLAFHANLEAKSLTGTVRSPSLGRDLPVTLHTPDAPPPKPKRTEPPFETPAKPDPKKPAQPDVTRYPLIVYLKNLPIPRLGTTPDDQLIASFLKRGFLVAEVDYQNQPMGKNQREIFEEYCHIWMSFNGYCWNGGEYPVLRIKPNEPKLPRTCSGLQNGKLIVDDKHYPINGFAVYLVPAGYDLVTAEVPHGYVELLLPSKPQKPVPLVMNRMPGFLNTGKPHEPQVSENDIFCYTFAYSGYGVGSMYHYAEFENNRWVNGTFTPGQKIVRMLRARKNEFGLDGRIGLMGISGSSSYIFYTSVRRPGQKSGISEELANTPMFALDCHGTAPKWAVQYFPEDVECGGIGKSYRIPYTGSPEERDRGPYGDVEGRPDVFLISDGGPGYALPYVDAKMPPLIFTTSARCATVGTRGWSYQNVRMPELFKQLGAKNFEFFFNPGLEHSFDYTKIDHIMAFFERHLRGPKNDPAKDAALEAEAQQLGGVTQSHTGLNLGYEKAWVATPIAPITTPVAAADMPKKESFHIFLLLGQSNMVGAPNIKPEDQKPVEGVLKLRGEAADPFSADSASPVEWVKAAHPVFETQPAPRHPWSRPVGRFSLAMEFAKAYREKHPGATVGLVPCAWCGASIDQLSKGAPTYENLIRRAKAAGQVGTIRGVLWQHGETDAMDAESAKAYEAKLQQFISDLRADLAQPDLRFAVGELPDFSNAKKVVPRTPISALIQKAIISLPSKIKNTSVVSGKGLSDQTREKCGYPIRDKIFIDRNSLMELGRRFAAAFE